MKKITIIGNLNFSDEQLKRLESIGDVIKISQPESSDGWTQISEKSDIICSNGGGLLDNIYNIKNVFVTYPYIELGNFDSKKLEKNNLQIANSQGSNRNSIVEWVLFMTLALFRKFPPLINTSKDFPLELNQSLAGKNVLIIGKGNIGTRIGTILENFEMNVDYFVRGDNLLDKSKNADLIVNALNCNSTSKNLLNEKFFMNLKKGSYFVSFVRQFTYDLNGLIKSLDNDILAGAAIDCDPEKPGNTTNDFYQVVLNHNKILATPHIAFATQQAKANGLETVINNIEAFASGKPINLVKK